MRSPIVAFLLFFSLASSTAFGQSRLRKAEPSSRPPSTPALAPLPAVQDALYQQVAKLDAEMFAAFNAHDVDKLISYFAPNLEFFHDKGGLSDFNQTKAGFTRLFARSPDISRTLVPGSLEVFPVKGYGAMHIATQRFCHVENDRNNFGNFKFVMVWQQQADIWKITRVVSYDH